LEFGIAKEMPFLNMPVDTRRGGQLREVMMAQHWIIRATLGLEVSAGPKMLSDDPASSGI
jgi:hypothetical protein